MIYTSLLIYLSIIASIVLMQVVNLNRNWPTVSERRENPLWLEKQKGVLVLRSQTIREKNIEIIDLVDSKLG